MMGYLEIFSLFSSSVLSSHGTSATDSTLGHVSDDVCLEISGTKNRHHGRSAVLSRYMKNRLWRRLFTQIGECLVEHAVDSWCPYITSLSICISPYT